jgi:hypothetical protein
MNQHLEELIQLEIDGVIGPGELKELDAAAANDPEVKGHRERMLQLSEDLGSLSWREPGPELHGRIMREIGVAVPHRKVRRARMPWRIGRREAVAFAAGIALVIVVGRFVPVIGDGAVDRNQAAGTLLPPADATVSVDQARIDAGPMHIEARTERSGDRLFLRARGEGDAVTPVRIDWDAPAWSVVSTRCVPPGDLGVDRGRARFVQGEPGPYVLEIELQLRGSTDQAGDVRLRLGSGDPGDPTATLGTTP